MWNVYDELGIGIPSGILVEGCVVGKLWTTVRANGNIGVARTLGDTSGDLEAVARSVMGKALRDVANHMHWDNLLLASIGVAAYNSFYNSADHVATLNAPPAFQGELAGKKVVALVSGGNIDVTILNRVITRGLVMSGRKVNLMIALEDKPGQLTRVSEIISGCGANVVSVQYDLADTNMAITSCFLKLGLETRDAAQIEEIRQALAAEGFKLVSERA